MVEGRPASGLSDPISAGRLSWKSPLLPGGEREAGRELLGHPWYWLEHPVWLGTVARYPTLPCLLILVNKIDRFSAVSGLFFSTKETIHYCISIAQLCLTSVLQSFVSVQFF